MEEFRKAYDFEPHVAEPFGDDDSPEDKEYCSICWYYIGDAPPGLHLNKVVVKEYPRNPEASCPAVDEETFFVEREFQTHWESWGIIGIERSEAVSEAEWLPRCGFQDREGKWWLLYHSFHHTEKAMRAGVEQSLKDYAYRKCTRLEL